ncbi:MAG: DNA/RNA nuclease SfsA [archaeon GB-1867-035]|nr:DNA/RNA nuclease SfsA [Candidatus Culexmicrobium profundum]
MQLTWTPIKAKFINRPNRFTAIIEIEGKRFKAHIHDPGRLKELLIPNTEVLVRKHSKNMAYKTQFYLFAVKYSDIWVLVDSALHNEIVAEALNLNLIKELQGYKIIGREVKYGDSRIDFLLKSPLQKKALMEVKGCTLVTNGLALFPDAPTERGRRHVQLLIKAVKQSYEALIFFLITRADAERFKPNWKTDPKFSEALCKAKEDGVKILAYKAPLNIEKMEVKIEKSIKVIL